MRASILRTVLLWILSTSIIQAEADTSDGLRTYGEDQIVNYEEAWADFSTANMDFIGGTQTFSVTSAEALRLAHKLFEKGKGVSLLKAAKEAVPDTPPFDLYRMLAGRSGMQGNFSTALVFMVGALDLAPKDDDCLFNVASLLASLGHVNEALALYEDMWSRGASPSFPLGISGRDAIDYARAYCWARRGDTERARSALTPLRDRTPLLAEASRLLALIDEQEGKDPRRAFLLGVWRRNSPLMVCGGDPGQPNANPINEGADIAIDLRDILDLSRGVAGRLPTIHYAASPEEVKATLDQVEKLGKAAEGAAATLGEKRNKIKPSGYTHTDSDVQEVWGYRKFELVGNLHIRDAKLRNLEQAYVEANRLAVAAYDQALATASHDFSEAHRKEALARIETHRPDLTAWEIWQIQRPYLEQAMAAVKSTNIEYELALGRYFSEWHLLASAVAAQVGDSRWNETIRLQIEIKRQDFFRMILHCARRHAKVGESPFAEARPTGAQGLPETQNLNGCDSSQSVGFGINKLGFGEVVPFDLGVELTCEGFSVEAGIDVLPMLSVSGELGIDTKGQISAFVGPKIDASLAGNGVTVKEGFYVSANRDGIQDAGAKIETKANLTKQGFGVSRKLNETAISFLPVPQNGPPAGLSPLHL